MASVSGETFESGEGEIPDQEAVLTYSGAFLLHTGAWCYLSQNNGPTAGISLPLVITQRSL